MTELKLSPKKPRENSREYVFRMMYDNIMSFQLVPGTAISEQDISSQLDISRTPVRDAFVRLAQLKLLDIVPQRKTTVSRIHTEQLDDSCFMRQAVECAIIKQACEKFPKTHMKRLENNLAREQQAIAKSDNNSLFRLDEVLHKTIFDGCHRGRIWDYLTQTDLNYLRTRVLVTMSRVNQMEIVFDQHRRIVEAIKNQDKQAALDVMGPHVVRVLPLLKGLKEFYPTYFA